MKRIIAFAALLALAAACIGPRPSATKTTEKKLKVCEPAVKGNTTDRSYGQRV